MSNLTERQSDAIVSSGFAQGVKGYPVLFAENGKITVVEEGLTRLIVWDFDTDGSVESRSYNKEGV